jgi:hypothetical protein
MPASQAQLLWEVGLDDNGWPVGGGGGANASFVQENGVVNELPGNPEDPAVDQLADNDYYLAGVYTEIIPSNGDYFPLGFVVSIDEEAAERALTPGNNELRYHFNLPETLQQTDLLSVSFDIFNLDTRPADPRWGIEVYFNGVLVQPEILIRPAQINTDYATPQFSLASVNAQAGPGFDNIVTLKGVTYNNDGGGDWMGIDYIQLNQATEPIPVPVFPWAVGLDDNAWPAGDGGGTNTSFVQENGEVNPLPGVPNSPEVDQQADNDYYFGGSYTTVIAGNGEYEPVGVVPVNEEAAERALTPGNSELRYHFNLPNTMQPTDLLAVTFDAFNLHDEAGVADPRYGIEIYVNGVLVQPEILIRPAQLDTDFTTPQFSLASVNAQVGSGIDNIVSLRGISYSAEGGGDWMGIDYVQLNPVAQPIPAPVLPWSVGRNDNAQPVGAGGGGGPNASFVQEDGLANPLPGDPNSPEVDQEADDDYYFAGTYTTVIAGNGDYSPVGPVPVNEEAAERAFAAADNDLRYHFNLPANLSTNDQISVSFDAVSLQDDQPDPRYGIEVYFNGVKVQSEIIIRLEDLGTVYNTPPFTLASVNAQVGPGFDNIVSLKGINYNADGGGNWMGLDFIQLNPILPAPFPWSVGRDDNAQPVGGTGGGPNTSFVQESGVNPPPGNPNSPAVNQQADDDYYFAGEYLTVIPGNGEYEPVGVLLVNEQAAERAFAGADNDLRYHFNLPSTLQPTDQLMVTFDAISLDSNGEDPRYGIEIYFNGVLVQPEIVITTAEIDVNYTTPPFTLATVDARVGPGFDNIVHLRGINYNAEGGGNWMGIDYIQLDPLPTPVFPWAVGLDDDGWPVGDGGGPNATFVQEAGVNSLPGIPNNPEVNQQADDDYYFAGIFTNTIPGNGEYDPAGVVPRNEEAAERAFAGSDNDLRYHFNLPGTLRPTNLLSVTFDALNLHEDAENPLITESRYGIEIYFNGVLVQPEIIIRTNDLGVDFTTPEFTLESVDARVGPGHDNIVHLRGINYDAEGGCNWMGIDYVQLNGATETPMRFTSSSVSNGTVTLNWTGGGTLEWSPVIVGGTWTSVTPAPNGTYSEAIVSGQNRFYRLRRP